MEKSVIATNNSPFTLQMQVRDYEVDMQGRVNNAIYLNYCEHARHEYLKKKGFSFKSLMDKDFYFVARETKIKYLWPLTHDDLFNVSVEAFAHRRTCIGFKQLITTVKTNKEIAALEIIAACVNAAGKPIRFPYYQQVL